MIYKIHFSFPDGEYSGEIEIECSSLQRADDKHLLVNGAALSFPPGFEIEEIEIADRA